MVYCSFLFYLRETLDTPDGGIVCLDWFDHHDSHHNDPAKRPTVLLIPGLTGKITVFSQLDMHLASLPLYLFLSPHSVAAHSMTHSTSKLFRRFSQKIRTVL